MESTPRAESICSAGTNYVPAGFAGEREENLPGQTSSRRYNTWFAGLRAYEWLTLGYLCFLNLLLTVFPGHVNHPWRFFAGHACIAAGIVGLCWAEQRWPHRALRFWRHWYPFLLFIFFFEELHYLSHLIHPRWFDSVLLSFDYALFGTQPTLWLEQFTAPLLNDAMAFAYLTYYFYTVVLVGILYARQEMRAFRTTMLGTAIAYGLGYGMALLWPMEGPHHTLRHLQHVPHLDGYFFTAVINLVQGAARVHGAAFPSLHVAGATVAVLAAWRYRPGVFWIFLPNYLAMLVATVYGRYHYFADLPAGFFIGAIGFAIAMKIDRKSAALECGSLLPLS